MNCPHCEAAKTNPNAATYHSDCYGCQVRATSQTPQFSAAMKARDMELKQYADMMERVFGDDWRQAHEDVKAEYRRIKALRQGAGQ